MYSTLITVALFVTFALQSVLAEFAISTPELTQCKKSSFSWADTGNPPYNLIIVAADAPCGDSLSEPGDYTGTTGTWLVTLAAGSKVLLSLEDAAGDEAWSGSIVVGDSDDDSCLPNHSKTQSSSAPASTSATSTVVPAVKSIAASDASTSAPPVPVGAANAANPFGDSSDSNGAFSSRQLNTLTVLLSAILALVVLL